MNSNSESLNISFDFYHESDFMKCIGITPRINDNQNASRLDLKNKIMSKLETRKQSFTVASQKIFKFQNPSIIKQHHSKKKISFGFFGSNELRDRNNIPSILRRSRIIKSQPKLEVKASFSNIKLQNHSNWSTEISNSCFNIQRVLRVKQRLRKSNFDFREEASKSSPYKSPTTKNSAKGKLKQFLFETRLKSSQQGNYDLDVQKIKVIKSLKKSHIIKRVSQCKLISSSFNKIDNTNCFKLNVTGTRLQNDEVF